MRNTSNFRTVHQDTLIFPRMHHLPPCQGPDRASCTRRYWLGQSHALALLPLPYCLMTVTCASHIIPATCMLPTWVSTYWRQDGEAELSSTWLIDTVWSHPRFQDTQSPCQRASFVEERHPCPTMTLNRHAPHMILKCLSITVQMSSLKQGRWYLYTTEGSGVGGVP